MVSREQIKIYLLRKKFDYERDTEYNRDVFTTYFDNTKLEIFVDRYTLRLVWWYKSNRKAAKCFHIKYMTEPLDEKFVEGVIMDLAKYL